MAADSDTAGADAANGAEDDSEMTDFLRKLSQEPLDTGQRRPAASRRRQWQSAYEPPNLSELKLLAARSEAADDSSVAARRIAEELDDGGGGAAVAGVGGAKSGKSRSAVKQLLGSFRPRARSENPASLGHRPAASGDKRRKASAGSGVGECAGADDDVVAGGGGGGGGVGLADSGDSGELAASVGQQLGTIRQGEEYVHAGEQQKRSRSPMGGIVTRLRQLTATDERRRRQSPGKPPVQGLPHPSDMPLDASYMARGKSFDSASDRKEKTRKAATSVDAADTHLDSHTFTNVQERHRDLFEASGHLSDTEGQQQQSSPGMSEPLGRTRRRSGPPGRPNSVTSDLRVTENDKYIILRSKSQKESVSAAMEAVREESASDPDRVYVIFSQKHRCYDLIPTSSKLLVFDQNLNVKKAFFALVYNGLRAAPVWDSDNQRFVGMLTITDFIHILNNFYKSALVPMEELESHRISTWRAQLHTRLKPFLWISPEASLLDAVKLLLHERVHRLPVVNPKTGNALFILTHKRILKYIYLYFHQLPIPAWMRATLSELGIGTLDGILTVREATSLVEVLGLFVQHRISALPVVSADGKLVDIYSKFDVINLAATKTYNNLDVSVKEALQYRSARFEGVTTCRAEDSLMTVIEKLVTAEVHRIVIVDNDNRVRGVVSLSDILQSIVINRCVDASASVEETPTADGDFVTGEPMDES